jgi:hypothetical protein
MIKGFTGKSKGFPALFLFRMIPAKKYLFAFPACCLLLQ